MSDIATQSIVFPARQDIFLRSTQLTGEFSSEIRVPVLVRWTAPEDGEGQAEYTIVPQGLFSELGRQLAERVSVEDEKDIHEAVESAARSARGDAREYAGELCLGGAY